MIVLTGGTGFVGRHLVAALVGPGRTGPKALRCLVRDPSRAAHLAESGVELVRGDVTDPASVAEAIDGATEAVIHLVGILAEPRGSSFSKIHVEGTRNVVEACLARGVERYLHVSALGTRPDARSEYHRTKWEAEEIIRASGLAYTIFRPSVIFGPEDKFTNLFARVLRRVPVVVIPGSGKNLFQPVYVDDVAGAIAGSLDMDETAGRVFELGGPRAFTFDETMDEIARALGRRAPLKIHVPMALMRVGAALAEAALPVPPITRDQLLMLEEDNVTDSAALEEVFGITPTAFAEGMRTYLH